MEAKWEILLFPIMQCTVKCLCLNEVETAFQKEEGKFNFKARTFFFLSI